MGSLAGSEPGAIFSARRGVEKILFYVTIGFSALLVVLVVTSVLIF
jgi:preprotein translocase subunit SecG